MNIDKLKRHMRVDHDFEDELISDYQLWAESEIKDSVSTSDNRNEDYFEDNPHFDKAVTLLTTHYFENRLPQVEVNLYNLPFGVTSAIQKMRGEYYEE